MNASASTYTPIAPPPRDASETHHPRGTVYGHLPWLAAVLAAPFLFGAVSPEIQAALALPIALSLLWVLPRLRCVPQSAAVRVACALLLAHVALSLLPLGSVVRSLSPEAARLAENFSFTPRLALSPGDTILRGWQLTLFAAVFLLAREAATAHRFSGAITYGVCMAVLASAAAHFWFLADGKGIWNEVRHYPAGTFPNRNHFASWMVMGTMLLIGAAARKLRHIARGKTDRVHYAAAALLGAGVLAGLASVIASGSRGGMLALAAGLAFWFVVFWRQRSRGVAATVLGLVLIGGAAAFGIWGELFMQRLTHDALSFKVRIWQDALGMTARFPIFGVGLGAFEPAFGLYKTFHGEGTFLFAENETVQWLAELGAIGLIVAILFAGVFIALLRKPAVASRAAKTDLAYGALAGFCAFAVHSSFEFVAHVGSTALFAAALLGFAVGLKERAAGPAVLPVPGRLQMTATFLLAVSILTITVPQLRAALLWRDRAPGLNALNPEASRQRALETWPFDRERAITLARQYVALAREKQMDEATAHALAEAALARAIAWRPLDWQLRLELSWLRIAAAREAALPEALQVMRLNPLQAKIPLRYAETFARLHPPSAIEILRQASFANLSDAVRALEIAWSLERSPALLWELTPATRVGFDALEQFAQSKRLTQVAREAAARRSQLAPAQPDGH